MISVSQVRRSLHPSLLSAVISAALVFFVVAQAEADPRAGFVLGGGLGFAESNFNLEATNNDADIGSLLEIKAGYAWENGFALTFGVSELFYEYRSVLVEEVILLQLSFTMAELSAWYIFHQGGDWEFFVRGGIGGTTSRLNIGVIVEEESEGLVFAGGGLWYFSSNVALSIEACLRSYGVTFNTDDFNQREVKAFGLTLGLLWR